MAKSYDRLVIVGELFGRRRRESVGVLAGKHAEQSHGDDLQIEGETPVAKVIKVVFDALGDGSVSSPTVDLGPSRDSGFEHVAGVITIKLGQEPLDKEGTLGTRANDAHIASEHIQKLGEFIEIRGAQERADCSATRILLAGPTRVSLFAAAYMHGPEFVHAEDSSVQAHAVLSKEDWAAAGQLNGQSDEQGQRESEQQNENGQGHVEYALLEEVRTGLRQCGTKVEHVDPAQIDKAVAEDDAFAQIDDDACGNTQFLEDRRDLLNVA